MKAIHLPIGHTISLQLTPGNIKQDENGKFIRELGQITSEESSKALIEIETARENGGKVLYATTNIEQKLETILLQYFLGSSPFFDAKKNLFQSEVLQSTALGFSKKKELVSAITHQENFLSGKEKDKLQKLLKQVMIWRNAFAHGKILYDTKKGCLLDHYNNGKKTISLSDEWWDDVVKTFFECNSLLERLTQSIWIRDKESSQPST